MRFLPLLLALIPGPFLGAQAAGQTPEALARALQQRYQSVRDFTAEFVQTYRGGVLRTQTQERGTVSVKKPGRMRWVYTSPERKEFVSDGVKIYSYIPEDRQVIVSDVPAEDEASTGVLFLAGLLVSLLTAMMPPVSGWEPTTMQPVSAAAIGRS